MKILILTGNFLPDIGGPARMLDVLVKDLLVRGMTVKVLTSAPSDGKKYAYKVFRVSRRLFKPLRLVLALVCGAVLSLMADILYVTDIYSAGQAFWAKKILGKKLVIRFVSDPVWDTARSEGWTEDGFEEFQKNNIKVRSKKLETRIGKMKKRRDRILKAADRIITCSIFLKDYLAGVGVNEDKIKVIYNSVERLDFHISKTPEQVKKELGINGKMLITNPRLVPWKSVEVLIQVVSKLSKISKLSKLHKSSEFSKTSKINLVVLGEGSEMEKIKKMVGDLNLQDKVFILGKKLGQEFVDLMNAADIFVYNTSYEGMSHAILDVMQLSKPIITTNIESNREILKDGEDALLVEYNNLDEWVRAISKLLDDEDLGKRMVENYHQKMDRFDWDRLVEETVEVLDQVAGNK